jgi:ABC-type Mn2+/Zn2+ transport system ATPase subunit
MEQSIDISKYVSMKNRFGSFWGLFFCGFVSLTQIKFILVSLIVSALFDFVTMYFTNQLIKDVVALNKSDFMSESLHKNFLNCGIFGQNMSNELCLGIAHKIFTMLMLSTFFKTLSVVVNKMFAKTVENERKIIPSAIAHYIDVNYSRAPYSWKSEHPDSSHKESISSAFFSYQNTIYTLVHICVEFAESFAVVATILFADFAVFVCIVISTVIITFVRKYVNKSKISLDKELGDINKDYSLDVDNAYALRDELYYNPMIAQHIGKNACDPVYNIVRREQLWIGRTLESVNNATIINVTKNVLSCMICVFLISRNNYSILMFFLMNQYKIFGLANIFCKLDESIAFSIGKLASTYKMLDTLAIALRDYSAVKHSSGSVSNCTMISNNACKKIGNTKLTIKSQCGVTAVDTKNVVSGIILLNGRKGCGKSVTMDVIAGLHDGNIANNRMYVRQTVAESYKFNNSRTITMRLSDLFPCATYEEICEFVGTFDIVKKLPTNLNDRVSRNERSLSPGQLQTIVIASQLWKSIKFGSEYVLLDEPERNIDFETVTKIFDKFLSMYTKPIFLITHCDQLKTYVGNKIVQIWNYDEPSVDASGETILSFTTQHHV